MEGIERYQGEIPRWERINRVADRFKPVMHFAVGYLFSPRRSGPRAFVGGGLSLVKRQIRLEGAMAHKLNNTSKICFMTAGSIAITLIGLQIFFPSALYAIGHYNLILLIHKVIPGLFFISFTTNLAADYWNENKIITVQ